MRVLFPGQVGGGAEIGRSGDADQEDQRSAGAGQWSSGGGGALHWAPATSHRQICQCDFHLPSHGTMPLTFAYRSAAYTTVLPLPIHPWTKGEKYDSNHFSSGI